MIAWEKQVSLEDTPHLEALDPEEEATTNVCKLCKQNGVGRASLCLASPCAECKAAGEQNDGNNKWPLPQFFLCVQAIDAVSL